MQIDSSIFKAYDIRGTYPDQINEATARRIGESFAAVRRPKSVVVGRDVRSSGENLKNELIDGLLSAGVNVVDIGVITTDQLYFAVGNYNYDGGISVTASHNPSQYNGFKFSIEKGAPPSIEDLANLQEWAVSDNSIAGDRKGSLANKEILNDYINHVMSYIDVPKIKPFKILVNANFGAVGRSVDIIGNKLKLQLETLNWPEDGSFPKGPPNPLLPDSREEMIAKIKSVKPDMGVAWDADADRCFFFAGTGEFIPSCFIIALLSQNFLKKWPGSKIIHDLTTAWVIDDIVKQAGGISLSNRTGHTFIKRRMRQEDAIFAGESSGHYYFKDSFYADNGLVPFLIILELMSESGKSLDELVRSLMDKYKVSGEINFKVVNPPKVIEEIEHSLGNEGTIDKTDGLVVTSENWRFSVRASNTEPLFRLNAEAKSQQELDNIVERVSTFVKAN